MTNALLLCLMTQNWVIIFLGPFLPIFAFCLISFQIYPPTIWVFNMDSFWDFTNSWSIMKFIIIWKILSSINDRVLSCLLHCTDLHWNGNGCILLCKYDWFWHESSIGNIFAQKWLGHLVQMFILEPWLQRLVVFLIRKLFMSRVGHDLFDIISL